MTPAVTDAQWQLVRIGLAENAERFAEMTRRADPRAMATAHWTVADTAAHVVVLARSCASIVDPQRNPWPFPALAEPFAAGTVENVHEFNALGLRLLAERDTPTLAGQLIDSIGLILESAADQPPAKPLTWLGGSRVPVAGVLAHMLNELHIHGRDIARALRLPWPVQAAEAGLFWELFFIGMLRHSYGGLLDDCTEPPRERRIAVGFRSAYTAPSTVVLHRGVVSLDEPDSDVDVRVRFDPVTLNLLLFGRVSRARAVLTGKVVIGGPRPWLLPVFLRTVHMPN